MAFSLCVLLVVTLVFAAELRWIGWACRHRIGGEADLGMGRSAGARETASGHGDGWLVGQPFPGLHARCGCAGPGRGMIGGWH
jgi:hypothetical protein